MTWLELFYIGVIFFVLIVICMVVIASALWAMSKPLGKGPERIVDIHNRGQTRIRMPDGTIK